MSLYEKKYKEALGWIQSLYNGLHGKTKEEAERYFPELKESEDEKMIIAIKEAVSNYWSDDSQAKTDILAWLEKQGEQNNQHLYDIIIALWDLLDKIDTFSDLQIDDTNPDNPFRKIEDITQERHKFVKSDGYDLFIEDFMITNDKNSENQGKQKETLCDKCKREQPSHSCQDITELGRCAVEHEQKSADKVEPKFHKGEWITIKE